MSTDRSSIDSYVRNKFINSDYIKKRTNINSTQKYYEEEIQFWVEKIYNSNWTEGLFNAEFESTYNIPNTLSSPLPNDYIGQTFKIDALQYPKGLFIMYICVYTATEDSTDTITLQLRRLINGVPESQIIPLSSKTIGPAIDRGDPTQLVQWTADTYPGSSIVRKSIRQFKFDFPVYVEPGYYCFTLSTTSSKYSVYITENGKGTLDTKNTVVNPYLGDFIYSGQGESWVIDPTRDLCFVLGKAKFVTGTRKLYIDVDPTEYPNSPFAYDLMYLKTSTIQFPGKSYISDFEATITEFGTDNHNNITITPKSNIILPSHSIISDEDDIKKIRLTLTLENNDENLTPIVDLQDTSFMLVKNIIDAYSQYTSDSELSSDGVAFAKYITKPVILNDGFDADGITLYVDVNAPTGTSIEVFYRILNKYDYTKTFDNSPWYRLPKKSTESAPQLSVGYVEEVYEQLNIEYAAGGETYNNFNQMAIKVVFYSDDPTKIPTIKNLRAIATV